jgi:hypothetical protein
LFSSVRSSTGAYLPPGCGVHPLAPCPALKDRVAHQSGGRESLLEIALPCTRDLLRTRRAEQGWQR